MFLKIRQYLDFNKTKYHEKIINIEEITKVPLKVFDVEISCIDFKEKEIEKCIQS